MIEALIRLTLPIRLFCVVEAFDEVAQAFGGIRRKVEDVREPVFVEQTPDELDIQDRPRDECGARVDIAAQTAREIVQRHDLVTACQERDRQRASR